MMQASPPLPSADQLASHSHPCTPGRTDAAGEVTLSIDPDFDLDKTIFRTLTSPVTRWVRRASRSHNRFRPRAGRSEEVVRLSSSESDSGPVSIRCDHLSPPEPRLNELLVVPSPHP